MVARTFIGKKLDKQRAIENLLIKFRDEKVTDYGCVAVTDWAVRSGGIIVHHGSAPVNLRYSGRSA